MVALRNNFDGGTDGVTITTGNSGASGGNAFDACQGAGSGVAVKFANVASNNLDRQTAEYVMLIDTGSSVTTNPAVAWNATSLGTNVTMWVRFYVYFSTVGFNSDGELPLFAAYNGSPTNGISVWLEAGSSPPWSFMLLNNGTGLQTIGVVSPTAGTWNRVEVRTTLSATVGSTDLYVYMGADADSDTPTEHIIQSSQNYGTTAVNTLALGQGVGFQLNSSPTYYSNWEVNNSGYPGPAPFRPGKGVPGILTNPVAIHMN